MKVYINIHMEHERKVCGECKAVITLSCKHKGKIVRKNIDWQEKDVTENEAAALACIVALKEILSPCEVEISINNRYVINSAGYLSEWEKNGWKRSQQRPIKNLKLWQQLYVLLNIHKVKFKEKRDKDEKHNAE